MVDRAQHPAFPDYWVHSDGSISRAVDSRKYNKAGFSFVGRILKSGYRQTKLIDRAGLQKFVRVNRLVCEAFHGPAPTDQHQAAHKNGVRADNRAENLYWATPKENKADSIRHGTSVRGVTARNQHGSAKLTPETVVEIRQSYFGRRGDLVALSRKFGTCTGNIYRVVKGESWAHIPLPERSALFKAKGRG